MIATLLSTGLSIAQDLGLHHLETDEAWLLEAEKLSRPEHAKALVVRETQKWAPVRPATRFRPHADSLLCRRRVFWALIRDEWFSIVYRRSYGSFYSLVCRFAGPDDPSVQRSVHRRSRRDRKSVV